MKRLGIMRLMVACGALFSAHAFAQEANLTIATVTTNVGQNAAVTVSYTPPGAGGLPIGGFSIQGSYTATLAAALNGAPTVTPGTGQVCSIDPVARTFNAGQLGGGATASVVCTFTFPIAAAATPGNNPLSVVTASFADAGGTDYPPAAGQTATPGAVNIVLGPTGPTLTYNPAGATAITVAASGSGTAVTSNIAVTSAGGDTGQSTTLACTIAGAGYAPPVVTGSPFAGGVAATGNVGLACGGTAGAGTLTCTQTRSGTGGGAPVVTTWPLTCASAPGFASTPAPGGTVSIVGPQGGTATGGIAVSNPGTAPLTLTGTIAGAAGITLGTISTPVAAGASTTVPLTCAVPATAGTTITATVTLNAGTTPATVATYTVNCLAQSASIPTLGFGGKALMVLLMLGFGLVGFQLYRRSA